MQGESLQTKSEDIPPKIISDFFWGNLASGAIGKGVGEGVGKGWRGGWGRVGGFPNFKWGSLKASHIKASHPHFPHFPRFRVRIFRIFRVFRVFVLRSLLRPLFSWGGRDVRIFRIFAVSGLNR